MRPPARPAMRTAWFAALSLAIAAGGVFAWYSLGMGEPEKAAPSASIAVIDATRIRVGISDDAMIALEYPTAQISATGPYTVTDGATGKQMMLASAGEIMTVSVNASGFSVLSNQRKMAIVPVAGPVQFRMRGEGRLKIVNITRRGKNPEFRGSFEIARGETAPGKLVVINEVSLEDYLKAVVPNELPMHYGVEAVKAQSIAARNYALRPREKPWKTFDICDSQYCQVYLGAQTETPGSNQTIAATYGQVALYAGEPVLALFSSSHGGYAENYANAFSEPQSGLYPARELPYLKGGPDVRLSLKNPDLTTEAGAREFWSKPQPSYDVESPLYRWQRRWSRPELETAITKGLETVSKDPITRDFVKPLYTGGGIGTLKKLAVLKRGVSGKIMTLRIETSKGHWTVQKEFLVRKVLTSNGKMLPSANVVFSHLSGKGGLTAVSAAGGGFGHGVGMSQLGASWMSGHGHAYPAIVQHYYKGASLGSIPIAVGQGGVAQPIQTRFLSQQARGTLVIESAKRLLILPDGPVQIVLNGKTESFSLKAEQGRFPVALRAGQINSLQLAPDAKRPDRPIKTWVELVPAR